MFPSLKYFRELYIALFIILVVMVIGVCGYIFIEDFSLSQALYMTIITVSTVGFNEVSELSPTGRYFTIFLIVISFGTFAYALSSLSKYILSGTYALYYKKYKMESAIRTMENHIIICGYGKSGAETLRSLNFYTEEVVVIDMDPDRIEQLRELKVKYIEGDATDENVLKEANIVKAGSLISALPKDTDNVFVVLTARQINRELKIVSRCAAESTASKLKSAGADSVILPAKVGGVRMAGYIINQNINRFIDKLSLVEPEVRHMREVRTVDFPDKIDENRVNLLEEKTGSGCLIIGILRADGHYVVNPDRNAEISENCTLFFLGSTGQIDKLNDYLNP